MGLRARRDRKVSELAIFHSKISALELGVLPDLGGKSLYHEPAIVEDIGALRHFQALHDVLLDQKERDAVGIDGLDEGKQFLDQERRQAERGFVEDQKLGLRHQPA